MEDSQINCPKCTYEYPYQDGDLWICPDCQNEWNPNEEIKGPQTEIKDSNGNILKDGDSVTVIKDLKIKGSSNSVKVGTKVKNIRLRPDSPDGHDIACKIDGLGAMNLKSEFVKKV